MNGNDNIPKKDKWWVIALSGFFGAIAPSLAKFISMTQEQIMPHPTFYIGALTMGVIGLGVALIARETVAWKAFTQGLSSPALISSAGTVAVSVTALMMPISIIPTAYADPIVMDTIIADTTIRDSVDIAINVKDGKAVYISQDGNFKKIEKTGTIKVAARKEVKIENKDASAIYYPDGKKDSVTLEINTQQVQQVQQESKSHFLKGFLPMMEQKKEDTAPANMKIKEIKNLDP